MIKNLPAMQETQLQSLGWDDPLEGESGGSVPERTETSLDNFLPLKHLLCWSGDHPALPLPMKRLTQAYQTAVF